MSHSLSRRLQLLHDAYKTTLNQIQQLQSLPPTATDSDRLDLADTIHTSLRSQEDTLELLRQELDDGTPITTRRNSRNTTEQDRNADLIARLSEDLRAGRSRFRQAQLQAKRNADNAKRKEREALFKRNHNANDDDSSASQQLPARRAGQGKLTQEDIARNASEDVTRALRRTHDLMTANLSQSQFAQQTLDESQDALKGLAESYGGTSDLLKNSRSLVGQLVRSNKSDTWYLQTAFYMLAITIAWLVFRRLLYGPLWWLVWQPIRLLWASTLMAAGMVVGGVKGKTVSSVGVEDGWVSTATAGQQMTIDLARPFGGQSKSEEVRPSDAPNVEAVGKMAEAAESGTNVDDITDEERQRQKEQPRNPKKRMMEVDIDADRLKDEL